MRFETVSELALHFSACIETRGSNNSKTRLIFLSEIDESRLCWMTRRPGRTPCPDLTPGRGVVAEGDIVVSRSIEQLVNQQVMRWQEEQRVSRTPMPAPRTSDEQGLMICISREFGGLGGEMGRIVAEELGFRFYAQELVHEIARRANVRRQLVESLDERLQSRIGQWVNEMMEGGVFAPSDYLRNLSRVILTLGRHGKGIIIGRGGQFILDPARTLRVRCYAPIEQRIDYIAERDHMTVSQARAKVLRVDVERVAFYRQHFKVDVTENRHYDMLLNTGSMSLEECARLVTRAFRARFGS
jgi:hypothetical protein